MRGREGAVGGVLEEPAIPAGQRGPLSCQDDLYHLVYDQAVDDSFPGEQAGLARLRRAIELACDICCCGQSNQGRQAIVGHLLAAMYREGVRLLPRHAVGVTAKQDARSRGEWD